MLDASPRSEQAWSDARAWVVTFQERPGWADHPETIAIREPADVTAILTPVDMQGALSDRSGGDPGCLNVIWMPPGKNGPPSVEGELESWVREGLAASKITPIRASVRTARTIWGESRAVIYASGELLHDALDALVRFTIVERGATQLQLEMNCLWASIDADANLTHSVSHSDQTRQPEVNEKTVLATRMKAASLRIYGALEQLDQGLSDPSKRLFSELVLAANLYDRLDNLDEPIQFAIDHYELANTRLIDARTAKNEQTNAMFEQVLMVVIVALLIAQIVLGVYGFTQLL